MPSKLVSVDPIDSAEEIIDHLIIMEAWECQHFGVEITTN